MGRIHRYGQKHDPVVIVNLVAPQTREGRVLKTLLDKLEVIRKRLRSDKVFDVVGRLFEGVSLRAYMEQALTDEGADEAATGLAGRLTEGQVRAQQERERRLYGEGGEVQACLAVERERIDREVACRLLPGYVARFLEWAAPLLGLAIEGDLDRRFSLRPTRPGAFDALGPVLEEYPAAQRRRLTVHRPSDSGEVVFLHPGERVFERFRALVLGQLGREARRGAVFVDPGAANPYLLHVARVTLLRRADPAFPELAREEVLERRLVVLRQNAGIEECPPEHLLLLRGGDGLPGTASALAATSTRALDAAQAWLTERVATTLAGERRAALQEALSGRIDLLRRGYHYREAELAGTRSEASRAAREGDSAASARLATIKEAQRRLVQRRKAALAAEGRRHELVEAEAPAFVAHALVVPSSDPEDKKRYDAAVEAVAMQVSVAHETALGATIEDVHTPALARAAGLPDWPGFDLRSHRPDGRVLNIEVKGRSGQGEVELSENEWAKACSLREAYWLYVVYDCGTARPRPPLRVSDPFGKLLVRARGGVLVKPAEILAAAETAP